MNDLAQIVEWVARLERDHKDHVARTANMFKIGPVVEADHKKGVRLQTDEGNGPDGKPHKEAWGKMADRTGASSYLPKPGEHGLLIAPHGDGELGIIIPFGHTSAKPDPAASADETVHHYRDGQNHRVKDGHVEDGADRKHSRWVGDKPGEEASGGNFPHEMQRQLQGLRAAVTQNAHDVAGLHDAVSRMREIAQGRIPELASLIPVLNGDPESLKNAADAVRGKLEGYVAMTFRQMVEKLTHGCLDNVMGLVHGFMAGDIGGLLGEVEHLAAGAGLDVAGPLADARARIGQAAAGVAGALDHPLAAIEAAFAGTPAAGAFAALQGRIAGALGAAGSVAAGLGDLLDGQKHITKGLTRSYRLGGY